MSKGLFFLLLGTACMYFADLEAQGWVNGGNTLTANGTLGTNSNHSVIFETANLPRGILTNTGLWHLGSTTTPVAKVQITYNSVPGNPHLLLYEPANDYARFYFRNSNTANYFGMAASPATTNSAARLNFLYSASGAGDILTIKGDKKVGIGTTNPAATLDVLGNALVSNGLTVSNGGISGTNTSTNGNGVFGSSYYGVYGRGTNTGVYGTITGSTGYGVSGNAYVGVYATSSSTGGDGVRTQAYGSTCYGVNAYSSLSFGVYAATGTSSSYAGYFVGNVYSSGVYAGSDQKLKQNIVELNNAMDVITKLHPKVYEYRQDGNYKLMNLPVGKHYGLIAQDVEEVLPNLVKKTEFNAAKAQTQGAANEKGEIIDFKAVNYTELIPVMVKAMQEQQEQIEELKREIISLKNERNINTFATSAKLSEIIPNPVKGSATIQYAIPEGSIRAQLLLSDVLGRNIRKFNLNTSGTINIDATSLASGVYNYSLIVDNKTIVTRKMTVVK